MDTIVRVSDLLGEEDLSLLIALFPCLDVDRSNVRLAKTTE
jgi:hypothetical protein